jgi:FtsP/CotA-like multicopper oxidase with cupredoxin domain
VRFVNNLPPTHPFLGYESTTSVHLHGSDSLPQYDGYASDLTAPGQYKDYHWPNNQDARTIWYHDHAHEHTAENAYFGLAGNYLLHDADELALPIPHGQYDVPITIGDALFQPDGNLLFSLDNQNGQWGNVILVNGRPWPAMKVARRKYRFRILVATLSRSFEFSLSTGDPFRIIGTDGGLMPAPQTVTSYRQLSGERYEIVIDFAKYKAGQRVVLKNSLGGINEVFTNTDKIMAFDVTDDAFDPSDNSVPDVLNPNSDAMNVSESQSVVNRSVELRRENGQWTMNGHTWAEVVASNYRFVLAQAKDGTVETWTVKNSSGGWFHPFHTHLADFRILSRNGRPAFAWERGPKDVFYLGENEEVKVLIHFEGAGKYMVHCHNLIHEDHDMMTQYEVLSDTRPVFSPFAAPPKPLSAEASDPL